MLGRLVEVLREKPYDACLREHLFAPLGLTHAATGPYEAIMFRAAMGHIELEPGTGFQPAPVWALARSNAPAGAMLSMRPRDLLTFAEMHLNDGKAADGTQVLAPGTAGRMHDREVDLPYLGLMGDSWGLGFERFDTADGAIIGHDGSTIGQNAFLRMIPEAGVAVALLTNGGDVLSLYHDIVGHVLAELAGVTLPPLPTPPTLAGADRREPVRRHLLRRGRRPGRQPGRGRPDLARADPQGPLRGARREAGAPRARPLPRRQPDQRRARPGHAHAARVRRRRRRRPRPVPPRRPRRPARRSLTHPPRDERDPHEADRSP